MDYTRDDLIDLADSLHEIIGNDFDIFVDTDLLEETLPIAFSKVEDEDIRNGLSEKQYELLDYLYHQAKARKDKPPYKPKSKDFSEVKEEDEKMIPSSKVRMRHILEYNISLKQELKNCQELLSKKSNELEETVEELESTQVMRDSFEAEAESWKSKFETQKADLEETQNKISQLEDEIFSQITRNDDLSYWNDDLQKRLNTATEHFISLYRKIHQAAGTWIDVGVYEKHVNGMVQEKLERIFDSTQELVIAKLKNNCPLTDKETEYVIDKFNSIGL